MLHINVLRVSTVSRSVTFTDPSQGFIPLILLQKRDPFRRIFTLTIMHCMKISQCRPTQEVLLVNMEYMYSLHVFC